MVETPSPGKAAAGGWWGKRFRNRFFENSIRILVVLEHQNRSEMVLEFLFRSQNTQKERQQLISAKNT